VFGHDEQFAVLVIPLASDDLLTHQSGGDVIAKEFLHSLASKALPLAVFCGEVADLAQRLAGRDCEVCRIGHGVTARCRCAGRSCPTRSNGHVPFGGFGIASCAPCIGTQNEPLVTYP
jgi:hypothetical protein